MSTTLRSKNITISGKRTSFRLEPEIWEALEDICQREEANIHELCTWVMSFRPRDNNTSAIRAFVVNYLRLQTNPADFDAIEHGDNCPCGQIGIGQTLCTVLQSTPA